MRYTTEMKRSLHKKEQVLGVIPARLGSTRLHRKMLVEINGKPLVYYTWSKAKKAKKLDEVVIATDSKEIKEVAETFGARVVLTSASIKSGSQRVAAAAKLFKDFIPSIVVNIQGDEPMMPPKAIDTTVELLLNDAEAHMSTVATPFVTTEDLKDPGMVKVVLNKQNYALYFSRSIIPHQRTQYTKYLNHLGIYGFRNEFLTVYNKLKQTPLDKAESLEQLRVLEHGYSIKVGVGNFRRVEVNTPHELEVARRLMKHVQ